MSSSLPLYINGDFEGDSEHGDVEYVEEIDDLYEDDYAIAKRYKENKEYYQRSWGAYQSCTLCGFIRPYDTAADKSSEICCGEPMIIHYRVT